MLLTPQIPAVNLRLRQSPPGYSSDWHVAGDPTLIVIQQGCLRIGLRNGEYRDFAAGERFIAEDYLPASIEFDSSRHGHQAQVLGNTPFEAVHIKLKQRRL